MMASSAKDNLVCVNDFESYALKTLNKNALTYYKSGADAEYTLRDSKKAFSRLRIRPRYLRDVSTVKLNTNVLGQTLAFPIGVSPTAMQRMAHPEGEIATVKATASARSLMILSTISSTSLEDVAKAEPSSLRWFQLYIYKDRNATRDLVKRAEQSGFSGLVLTVDTPYFGNRIEDAKISFTLPSHLRLSNFDAQDIKSTMTTAVTNESNLSVYAKALFDPSLTWKDVLWLTKITSLPIIIKGILTAEDAILAVEHGASGILVSNHGGRQLDFVPATIEALPEVVRAVAGRCEVYLDGGVRCGTDVFKALVLGAKAVFVGRPVLWGLTHSGEKGVARILEILRRELELAMALAGCASLDEINPSMVVRQEFYSRL